MNGRGESGKATKGTVTGVTDVEKALEALGPRPVPQGLRERVLAGAFEARGDVVMTPRKWAAVWACAALLVVAVVGDAAAAKHQAGALRAFVSGPGISEAGGGDLEPLLAGIPAGEPALGMRQIEEELLARDFFTRRRAAGRKSLHESLAAIERLKGWIADEIPENPY